jgi:hypothetical protein
MTDDRPWNEAAAFARNLQRRREARPVPIASGGQPVELGGGGQPAGWGDFGRKLLTDDRDQTMRVARQSQQPEHKACLEERYPRRHALHRHRPARGIPHRDARAHRRVARRARALVIGLLPYTGESPSRVNIKRLGIAWICRQSEFHLISTRTQAR